MGNTFPQTATFICETCGHNLTFGYDQKRNKILAGIEIIDRANQEFDIETDPHPVVNLHPELPIDPERNSDPTYFPNLQFLYKYNKEKGADDDSLVSLRSAQKSMHDFKVGLDEVELDFRYLKDKRWNMLESKYGKNLEKVEKEVLKKAMKVSIFYQHGKWDQLYRDCLSEVEKAKRHPNFILLKQYLLSRKEELLIEKIYSIFNSYQEAYHELLPTLLSQKFNMPAEGNSSSANWKKVERVYGSLYENYGDLLIIPTSVNNLLIRDNHELFKNYTWEEYLDSPKAGRCTNFLVNINLNGLGDYYDAGIRNATFHEASKATKNNQEILLKTGKGGRIEKTISLIQYISYCNELFARSTILFRLLYKLVH